MNQTLTLDAAPWPQPAVPPARQATLTQCLALAVLLHALVVAVFGTAPGGVAREGDNAWGALQIRISGPGPADSAGRADKPLPYSGPPGLAPLPRWGGEVRDAPPQPSPEPGAAQLGVWSPSPTPSLLRNPDAARPQELEPALRESPAPVFTRPEPRAAGRRDDPSVSTSAAPPVTEPSPRPVPEPAAPQSTAPRLAPVDTLDAPVLDKPRESQRDIATPVPVPALPLRPTAPPAPRHDEVLDAPVTAVAAPPLQQGGAAAAPERTAPVPLLPEPVRPAAPAPAEPPRNVDVAPPAPPPPAARPAAAPPPSAAVEPATRPGIAGPAPGPREAEPVAPAPSALREVLPAPPDVQRPAAGSPDAGARTGADRATPPSAGASGPELKLELPRARAAVPSDGTRGVLNLVPPPPERRNKLTEGIEKAARSDCRTAYSGMGPLAVVPLVVDAARPGGCRW